MNPQQQLITFYKLLRQNGLNDSHSGNASIRENEKFIVTKTGACADIITPDDLITCPLHGAPTTGASLDASIHQRIYQDHPQHNAVLHAHNPYTIALTLTADHFEPVDFEGQLYFGEIDTVACDEENYLETMPTRISQTMKYLPVAIVQTHGVYAAAGTAELAYKWLCSLEQSAKIKWLAR
jgi:L-fuculose-phosphate aldolase